MIDRVNSFFGFASGRNFANNLLIIQRNTIIVSGACQWSLSLDFFLEGHVFNIFSC